MKKTFVLLSLSALFFIHCSGTDSAFQPAQAQENTDSNQVTHDTPEFKNAAVTGTTIAADAGYISNGGTIAIPTGFTAAQCRMTAAISGIEGSALSTNVAVNTTTGVVTCEKVVQERSEVPPESQGCVASYTIICIR